MAEKKTPGRKALAPAEKHGPEFIGKTPDDEAKGIEQLRQREQQLVEQFGDNLPWHPDHYEAAIRSELRRGCEAFLRAGSYLLVAQGCASHGEWKGMLERLGVSHPQAHRMMEASRRVHALPHGSRAPQLIAAAGSQSKLIELLSLPEDQFAELADSGKTGDLELDAIENMTRDELRAAVREARADIEAKDARIDKLSNDLNREHEKLTKAQKRWKAAPPDEQQLILRQAVIQAEVSVLGEIGSPKSGLRAAIVSLAEHADSNGLTDDVAEFIGDTIGRLLNAMRIVRDDEELPFAIPLVSDGDA